MAAKKRRTRDEARAEKKRRGAPPAGRPLKLTPEVMKVILDAKRAGLPDWQAASFARVSQSAFKEWKAQGILDIEDGRTKTPFATLVAGLEKAKSDMVAESLLRIRQAGKGGAVVEETIVRTTGPDGSVTENVKRKVARPEWTADAWLLERTQPDDFGRVIQRQEISGPDGGPVSVAVGSWADIAKLAESATAKKE